MFLMIFLLNSDGSEFLKKEVFFYPEEFSIGEMYVKKLVNKKRLYVLKECFRVRVPLKKKLKSFLETPGIFRAVIDNLHSLSIEKHVITNTMQCSVWLDKFSQKSPDFILVPFYIFVAKFEAGNPLSGNVRKNKFAAVYASLACLPAKFASKLDSILFSTLIPVPEKKTR